MISKELMSTKIKNRVGNKCLIVRSKPSNTKVIYAFKCSKCGETDEEIAEKYCGNPGCSYRRQ